MQGHPVLDISTTPPTTAASSSTSAPAEAADDALDDFLPWATNTFKGWRCSYAKPVPTGADFDPYLMKQKIAIDPSVASMKKPEATRHRSQAAVLATIQNSNTKKQFRKKALRNFVK
jgi:hypothetical protein